MYDVETFCSELSPVRKVVLPHLLVWSSLHGKNALNIIVNCFSAFLKCNSKSFLWSKRQSEERDNLMSNTKCLALPRARIC